MELVLRRVVIEIVATSVGAAPHEAARDWLAQALGRACLALRDPDCASILGPPVPGATLPLGARVPGTSLELDPASAAFNLGAMICGARPGPADHVAAALAAADYAARHAHADGVAPPTVADLLAALRQAAAFASALAADDQCRDDPWLCQRAADAFVATALLGGGAAQQFAAAHAASLDGSPLRANAPGGVGLHANTGACESVAAAPSRRERRAAGENAARALRHALAVLRDGTADEADATSRRAASPAVAAALTSMPPAPTTDIGLDAAFAAAVTAVYPAPQAAAILALFAPGSGLESLAVDAFVARLVRN
jgi:2-methylcitrate dehydratase